MPVTQHPLRRSVRAELPHTAPASGYDDQASASQLVVFDRERFSHNPGSVSGMRCQQSNSPWPTAFPPPPPPPRHFRLGFVRRLRRYYAAVRLLSIMAHRRAPVGFPMRSALSVAEDSETSRFPHKVLVYAHRVSDRVGSGLALPGRLNRCGLRLIPTTSAPQTTQALRPGACISRLNGWLAHPLSTLRPHPRGCVRMTRSRRSWLCLQRIKLSSTTLCRF